MTPVLLPGTGCGSVVSGEVTRCRPHHCQHHITSALSSARWHCVIPISVIELFLSISTLHNIELHDRDLEYYNKDSNKTTNKDELKININFA